MVVKNEIFTVSKFCVGGRECFEGVVCFLGQ